MDHTRVWSSEMERLSSKSKCFINSAEGESPFGGSPFLVFIAHDTDEYTTDAHSRHSGNGWLLVAQGYDKWIVKT